MIPLPSSNRAFRWLLAAALAVAAVSALPYAGGWNDGSRLASVESLVDHHTWRIDDSIFVKTPAHASEAPWPSDAADRLLLEKGTQDKLYIDGHYYSDKSPVPSLLMAGVYKVLQLATGLTAAKNPRWFCYLITLIFSGGAYVVSVFCLDRMAARIGLPARARLLVAGGFAFASLALPYVRHVNNHILLLGVFSLLFWVMLERFGDTDENASALSLPLIGTLAGLGYTVDLGVGPVLVLCTTGFLLWRTRSPKAVALMLLCAFPWFLVHHVFNYRIGGTFKPANAVPEYFLWPGSPFNAQNLTGGWAHRSVWHFLIYAVDLLVGKKGFLFHNLPVCLAIPAVFLLPHTKTREAALVPLAWSLILGTWLIYAASSNNYSGVCCSVRWFVPLLAPFFYLVAVLLKNRPEYETDLRILTVWALPMSVPMWMHGPWMKHMVPGYWFILAGAMLSWIVWRWRRHVAGATPAHRQ